MKVGGDPPSLKLFEKKGATTARRWRRGGDLGRGCGARARPGFGAAVIWGRVLGERRG